MSATHDSPLARLAREVRTGRRSAADLVERSLSRIDDARHLGAVVAVRADEARDEARRVDDAIARGVDPGPLAGLPVLIKDIEDVAGLRTTFGSLVFRDVAPAERDGVAAERLRAAGAVIVGKTNVPEFALAAYTSNRLYGPTRNPWEPRWSTGGSSGGSAAAIAAGLAAVATGTDVGGSVRIPAGLCGLVGFKPTTGLIGRDPIMAAPDLHTHGPLQSTVADVRLILEVLRGPTRGDLGALPLGPLPPARKPRRVLAVDRLTPGPPLPPQLDKLFRNALRVIEEDLRIPVELIARSDIYPSGLEPMDYFWIMGTEVADVVGQETIGTRGGEIDPVVHETLLAGTQTTREQYLGARQRRWRYARELDELLGEDSLLATPTIKVEGWLAGGQMPGTAHASPPHWVADSGIINLTGHPAISLPAGFFESGIPMGIQVSAGRLEDETLLRFAEDWEQAQPWPITATGYRPIWAE